MLIYLLKNMDNFLLLIILQFKNISQIVNLKINISFNFNSVNNSFNNVKNKNNYCQNRKKAEKWVFEVVKYYTWINSKIIKKTTKHKFAIWHKLSKIIFKILITK